MRRLLSLRGQWQREELGRGRGRRQVLTAGGQPGATRGAGVCRLPAPLGRVTASPRRLFVLEAWSSGSSLGRAQVRGRRAAGGAPAPGVQPSGTRRRASRVLRDASRCAMQPGASRTRAPRLPERGRGPPFGRSRAAPRLRGASPPLRFPRGRRLPPPTGGAAQRAPGVPSGTVTPGGGCVFGASVGRGEPQSLRVAFCVDSR